MKKYLLSFVFILSLPLAGCGELLTTKDSAGREHTKLETHLNSASQIIKEISPIANTVFPGAGLIATGIAGLLGIIGHSVTSVVVSHRRKSALDTVIKGVEIGSSEYDNLKKSLLDMFSTNHAIQEDISRAFDAFKPVKKVIADCSAIIGNGKIVDKHVQKSTKKFKEGVMVKNG